MKGKRAWWTALLILSITIACNNRKNESRLPRQHLYAELQVSGEQGLDSVNCRMQFRADDIEGSPVALDSLSEVRIDGQILRAGNAGLSGFYYELSRPLAGFNGTHELTIQFPDAPELKQSFPFTSFELQDLVFDKADLLLTIRPASDNAQYTVYLTDTAFLSDDATTKLRPRNGVLRIGASELGNLSKGPLTLQIVREEVRPLKTASVSGTITVNYALRSEIVRP